MAVRYETPERGPVRRALGSFAAGVTVITTRDSEGRPVGMTATAFTAVSFSPPSVLVCVERAARTGELIRAQGRYGVNLLGSDSQDLSNHCAAAGKDKALPDDWLETDARWQSPCLNSSMSFFDCTVSEVLETGTHVVIVGDVTAVGLSPMRESVGPLIHFRGAYRGLSPVPRGCTPDPLPIVFEDSLLMETY